MYRIGIIVFLGVEELDFVGPFEVLSYVNKVAPESTQVLLVGTVPGPIPAYNGLTFNTHATLETCPPLDVLVIPGGQGRRHAMHDAALLAFVRERAAQARYVTSVCTGAFVLAEAGLLHGRAATTYHTALDELAAYPGVTVTPRKVVEDGPILTAAGVSSGLELGFRLLAKLFGPETARTVAQRIEYAVGPEILEG